MTDNDKIQELIRVSETRMIKCVFPDTTNHYNTLFGGTALNWMDEIAFITATRFCRKKIVTVSLDKTDFQKPIPAGTFADIHGKVIFVGNKSLKIQVQIFIEQMYTNQRDLAVSGVFSMVALNENGKPTSVL
ncbi:acyl-CoA thioesterase [Fluviispira sanaruensis]|uniref:Acyl-CoA thioesterase n=1 Tax=Fluviispira sanaruensis TaxID=2493639 RepID=A0A4P2VRZ2_FLUSA|nr:acyl-CoA thioesterase [Fluviispira sanaruensis]BBH52005.1 acyl-CoA thioesterase [Fluviispira sanaruensis]